MDTRIRTPEGIYTVPQAEFDKQIKSGELVTIKSRDYRQMMGDSRLLRHLEAAGIVNTDAYKLGCQAFHETYPEYD